MKIKKIGNLRNNPNLVVLNAVIIKQLFTGKLLIDNKLQCHDIYSRENFWIYNFETLHVISLKTS